MIRVGRLIAPTLAASDPRSAGRVSPWASMPRMYLSWLSAIRMPEAVMKPEMTGWLRKFAKKPSRSNPMTISSSPDTMASAMAAPRYSGVPWAASGATAAAVMRLATATGPTASVREVPKIA